MKKILFYVHSLNKGGAERVLLTLGEELQKDYDVVIVTDCVDEREYELPKGIRRVVINDELDKKGSKVSAITRLKELRLICKDEKPVCAIAFMMSSSIRCLIANAFSRCKVISTLRSDPYESFGSFKKRLFVNLVFSLSKAIVCQTTFQQGYFYKPIRRKSVVIFNPIFEEFRTKSYEGNRAKRIVATGRLVDFKNYELMIEGFAAIAEDYPDINLEIFGEGPYREILEPLISKLNMKNRVLLKGDSKDVAGDIKDALFYVMTTNSEGMPNSLMEAMALGLPVLSTDCIGEGARMLIEDGVNGLLIPRQNLDELIRGYRRMLDDKELRDRLGKNAAEIQDRCAIAKITGEWQKLWE